MIKIKNNFLHSSKLISLGLASLALNGCGSGDDNGSNNNVSYQQDSVIQVVARDAILNTELGSDAYTVDLSSIVLEETKSSTFRLSDVSVINNDLSCNPTSIAQHSFTVRRNQAKVCDYEYAVVATNQTEASSAMVRVVVSNDENFQLPPLSQAALINEIKTTTDPDYSYEPITINLIDELQLAGTDVSGWTLSSSVTQPFAKGSTVVVDTTNHTITYTPAPGTSGVDRLMYSYTDNTEGQAYSGSIDIAVAENANQGIELLEEHVIYTANGKSYMPLADAIKGVTIDVSPYVKSIDGDDIQLIYVKSLTAPLTEIPAAQANNMTNMSFTFKASTQNVHAVTYVVSDHKGSYQIGHISVTVLDESTLPPWVDVTHAPSNTLFYAPKALNVAIANSYPFDESISARVSGQNYTIAGLYDEHVEEYCYQLGAELATSEEIKSLVDRGWLSTALWPSSAEYLVIDRASGDFKLIDISSPAYSINTGTLDTPESEISYFPACVVRSSATDRMLTSIQLTAKQRSGTSSISVPNGHSIAVDLTGYFNDGSSENLITNDPTGVSFTQSINLLTQGSGSELSYFTGHTKGVTDLTGHYYESQEQLRSNITVVNVTDAVAVSGTLDISVGTAPMGTEVTLDGRISYSDSSSKSISEETNITWLIDGAEFSGSHSLIDSITFDGSSWKLKTSSQNKGDVEIAWKINNVYSNTKTLSVIDAIIVSLKSIVSKDSVTDVESNSFPIGRLFYFTVMGNYSDGSIRDITSEIKQTGWEFDTGYLEQSSSSDNEFKGQAANSSNNTCGGVGVVVTAWIDGYSICGSVEITDAYLTSIAITPSNVDLPRGTQGSLKVEGNYSDGRSSVDITSICSLQSSNVSNVTVTNAGVITAINSATIGGTSTITSTCNTPYGDLTDQSVVTVTDALLESIVITEETNRTSAGRGEQLWYLATGYYSDGSDSLITRKVSWHAGHTYGGSDYANMDIFSSGQIRFGLQAKYTSQPLNIWAELDGVRSPALSLTMLDIIWRSDGNEYRYYTAPLGKTTYNTYHGGRVCQDLKDAKYGGSSSAWYWERMNTTQLRAYYDITISVQYPGSYYSNLFELDNSWFWSSVSKNGNSAYTFNIESGSTSYDWKTSQYNYMCIRVYK